MNELSNNNNALSNEVLNRVLIVTDNLSREGAIRFNAGISGTATIGKVDSLGEIFGKALIIALRQQDLPFDEAVLQKKLSEKDSLRNTFEGAREPKTRRVMIDQLRDLLTTAQTPVTAKPSARERLPAFA
jgi:hypothetical protein